MTTRWTGAAPVACDLCGTKIETGFYDVSIPTYGGTWGVLDYRCFVSTHAKLGVGFGQRYVKDQNGAFICVEGGRTNTPNVAATPDGD